MGLFRRHQATPASADELERYVFLDVEPTGFRVATDRIYEVGIVTTSPDGKVLERYETLVRPNVPVSDRIGNAVAEAPEFVEIAADVLERLHRGIVVGHNVSFDLAMIDAELVRLGLGVGEIPYLDTLAMLGMLRLDTPGRRLGPACISLGVEMTSWHTAAGDAETAGRLLFHLADVAGERGELARAMTPFVFTGAPMRTSPPSSGRLLPRDPVALPPLGEQPHNIDPASSRGSAVVSLSILPAKIAISEATARGMVRFAKKRLEERPLEAVSCATQKVIRDLDSDDPEVAFAAMGKVLELTRTPLEIGAEEAIDELVRDHFPGEKGIERLRGIVGVLDASGDEIEASQARLRVAEALRYSPKHGKDETTLAYADAFESALRIEDSDSEGVFGSWVGYADAVDDLDQLLRLLGVAKEHPGLTLAGTLVTFVHRTRTGGNLEQAIANGDVVAPALAGGGWTSAAADVRAEQAQALADSGRSDEAIEVCERAWAVGWSSFLLANRHSLLLERAKRYWEAMDICDLGLAIGEKGDQLAKRRDRCNARLGG